MHGKVPVALLASTQHWFSPFQIGTHHIARAMARRGYRVGFLSAPLSPLHLLPGIGGDKRARFRSWREGGGIDRSTGIWHAVPLAVLPAAPGRVLGNEWVVRRAWHTCVPPLRRLLARGGFESPDVVLTDHFLHGIGLEQIPCRFRIHRVADRSSAFPGATAAFDAMERSFLRRCDLTVTSSIELQTMLVDEGIASLLIENGVDLAQLGTPAARPKDYADVQGPIAVYVGATEAWVDLALIAECARANPEAAFFIIGPPSATQNCPSNMRFVGPRSRADIPGYLQHADLGLIAFRDADFAPLVRGINPLKLYEYAAAGLNVVSTAIPGAGAAQSLARVASSRMEFVELVSCGLRGGFAQSEPASMARYDWQTRLRPLFDRIEGRAESSTGA